MDGIRTLRQPAHRHSVRTSRVRFMRSDGPVKLLPALPRSTLEGEAPAADKGLRRMRPRAVLCARASRQGAVTRRFKTGRGGAEVALEDIPPQLVSAKHPETATRPHAELTTRAVTPPCNCTLTPWHRVLPRRNN